MIKHKKSSLGIIMTKTKTDLLLNANYTASQLTFSHKFRFTLNFWLCSHLSSKAEQNLNFSNIYKEKGKLHLKHLSAGNSSPILGRKCFNANLRNKETRYLNHFWPYRRNSSEVSHNWSSSEDLETILRESGLFLTAAYYFK